jgi:hypothetical protein
MPSGANVPHAFTTACGLITFNYDSQGPIASLDARQGYQASTMAVVLGRLQLWRIEPLGEDEAEPEILPDGSVRIHCARFEPRELEDCA